MRLLRCQCVAIIDKTGPPEERMLHVVDDELDCWVGPGGPPLHTRFRRGQSGNPGGRSKRTPGRCPFPGSDSL